MQAAFKDIATRWGTIHSLVTSAGPYHRCTLSDIWVVTRCVATGYAESIPTLQYPTSKLRRIFEINVYGSLFCAREAAQYMIKAKTPGTIVLIGSVAANVSLPLACTHNHRLTSRSPAVIGRSNSTGKCPSHLREHQLTS